MTSASKAPPDAHDRDEDRDRFERIGNRKRPVEYRASLPRAESDSEDEHLTSRQGSLHRLPCS